MTEGVRGPVFAAVDIGGTKTAAALFDADGSLLGEATLTTAGRACGELARECAEALRALCRERELPFEAVAACGIACPGPLDLVRGRVDYIPTLGWRDEPLLDWFRDSLGVPVTLENDTNAAALAEYRRWPGEPPAVLAYITVSTGVGCGLVSEGRVIHGGVGAAGELGHVRLVPDGRPCPCGGRGCLEMYASGTAVAQAAGALRGRPTTAREAFALARGGDAEMTAVVEEAGRALGQGIALLYQIADPGAVVLGGSMTNDYDLLEPFVRRAVEDGVQRHPRRELRIECSRHGGRQVLMGAAQEAMRLAGADVRPKEDCP